MADVSESPVISNDRLAKQLMECAILVKKGEKTSPLLRQTIHDLTDYLTTPASAATATPKVTAAATTTAAAAAATTTQASFPGNETPVNSHTASSGGASGARSETVSSAVTQPLKPNINNLGQVFGKMLGVSGDGPHEPQKTQAQKSATSAKNAQRLKADLMETRQHQPQQEKAAGIGAWFHNDEAEWCDVHFTRGCACKKRPPESAPAVSTQARPAATTPTAATARPLSSKPAFARPANPNSALIAHGWVEQQRRSKMRIVWKDVLASLVEGRRPGEETTLWIQREVTNQTTGHVELEALHQIPVKWLEEINYMQYSTDNRFSLKVFNLNEEFIFRCAKDDEAAQNWVLTLRSVKQIAQRKKNAAAASVGSTGSADSSQQEEKKADHSPHSGPGGHQPQSHHRMTITELRAIAHGAGINTHGMERGELETVAMRIAQNRGANPAQASSSSTAGAATGAHPTPSTHPVAAPPPQEKIPTQTPASTMPVAEREFRQKEEGNQARHKEEEEEKQRRLIAERVREQAAAEMKRREEEERARLAEERLRRDEEEIRKRVAEKQAADLRRKQEEAQRMQQQQWQQQQQQWQKQQAEEEQRRRAAEQHAAEERRRQEEAYRLYQQQYAQWQAHQSQHPQHQRPQPHPVPPPQQHFQPSWQQQAPHGHPPQPPNHAQQKPQTEWQQQQRQQQASPINLKYAKMAQQEDEDGTLKSMTQVKHGILVQWALQPPMLQVLRPIDELITSIHKVFPPSFGVPGHEYFTKWTAITSDDVSQGPALGNRPDEAKLKKAMRKLRFFLHPDKLPRDLSPEQAFVCKMLWDIVNDAEDEFKKKEEDLGWIRG